MSARHILTTLFLTLSLALIASQLLTTRANAVGSPLTSPVTPPLTNFETAISGKITLKTIGSWWSGTFKKVLPAAGVTVKLLNINTHQTVTTTTDASGRYQFLVDKGFYKVTPDFANPDPDIIAPPFRFVFLRKHDKMHVDFHAIDLP